MDTRNKAKTNGGKQELPEEIEKDESGFLGECKKAFGQTDLYAVFNLEKGTASQTDIKKSYYKMSLKFHPDKVADELEKDESKFKFQCLGKIYSILSDSEKKKVYDDYGIIDGEDEMFGDNQKDWDLYFRGMFKKITKSDIDKFFEGYKDSKEEREDLIKLYEKHKGDMDKILIEMTSDDSIEGEQRFKEILLDAIEKNETEKFDLFMKENKKKAAKRKAHYEKEAKEAEELKKEMGIDESQDSLRSVILARRKEQTNGFLENLEKKYGSMKDKKTIIFSKKKDKKKVIVRSDSEVENESGNSENDDSADTLDEKDDEEEDEPPKKRSSLVKKKPISKKKTTNSSAAKRKVKRL